MVWNRKLTLAVAALVAGTALSLSSAQAQDTIKIGAVLPLTGPVAYDGQAKQNGAMVAVDQINKAGGVLGRQIELLAEDGACNPAQSVAAAEKLITTQQVPVLMGAFCSSSTGAVMGVTEKYGVPHITSVSTAAELTERGNKWFFRATGTSKLMAETFSPVLKEQAPNNKLAIFVVNDDWGRTVAEWYAKYFEDLGGEVVATETFDRSETDLFPYITKIKARQPDIIMMAANTQLAASLTKQMKQMEVGAKLVGEGAFATETYYDLVGEQSEGVLGITEYVPTIESEMNSQFVADYKAKTGELPTKFSSAGYQDVLILADAIKRAGSTEAAAIQEALTKTNFDSLTGNFQFNENHQAYNFNVFLSRNENMTPVVLSTVKVEKP